VPIQASARHQFDSAVADNIALCRDHFRLVLWLEAFPPTEPGQFIQIACRDVDMDYTPAEYDWEPSRRVHVHDREMLSPLALLRRPFSLAGRRDAAGGVELEIIHRVVGVGTDWMSRLDVGDTVSILGPLGNRFTLPPADHTAVLVGGGVGIPPMLYLASKLAGRRAVAFCGATTKDLLPLTIAAAGDAAEFAGHGIPSIITTDDGSLGRRGLVTQALEEWLDDNCDRPLVLYTCGPELMMKRVAEIAIARGIPCQIAVERAMACGMGTCQSCCIRVRCGGDWMYKLACTDGPVFEAAELLW
jgi:dihydroorotate dehydrogenase electron transfer subunit